MEDGAAPSTAASGPAARMRTRAAKPAHLGPAIPDQFSAPWSADPDRDGFPVEGWRRTLNNGFSNGFTRYFKPAPDRGAADLSLDLVRADLRFVDGRAQIVYKARLLDKSGNELQVAAHTAFAKRRLSRRMIDSPEALEATDAVETMYEELAENLVRGALPVDGK
jgi:hypothetical protein